MSSPLVPVAAACSHLILFSLAAGAQAPAELALESSATYDGAYDSSLVYVDHAVREGRLYQAFQGSEGFVVQALALAGGATAWEREFGGAGAELRVVSIAAALDGGSVWVAAVSDSAALLLRLRTADGETESSSPIAGQVSDVACSRDGTAVYLGDSSSGRVLALDSATRSVLWENASRSSYGAMAVGADRLYVGLYDAVEALDVATGERLWRTPIVAGLVRELELDPFDELLAAGGASTRVSALRAVDGSVAWTHSQISGNPHFAFHLSGDLLRASTYQSYAYDVSRVDGGLGLTLWTEQVTGVVARDIAASPDGGAVAVLTASGTTFSQITTRVLDASAGSEEQSFSHPSGDPGTALSSPARRTFFAVDNELIAVGESVSGSSRAAANDAHTGALVWETLLAGPPRSARDSVYDAALAGDVAFVGGGGGPSGDRFAVHALPLDGGVARWARADASSQEVWQVAARSDGSTVFTRSERSVRALRGSDGSDVWKRTALGVSRIALAPDESALFAAFWIPPNLVQVAALDPGLGSELWSTVFDAGGTHLAEALAVSRDGGMVFVAGRLSHFGSSAQEAFFVALDAATGAEVWRVIEPFEVFDPSSSTSAKGQVLSLATSDAALFAVVDVAHGASFGRHALASYRKSDGALQWVEPAEPSQGVPSLAVSPDGAALIEVRGRTDGGPRWRTRRLDPSSGRPEWERVQSVQGVPGDAVFDVVLDAASATVLVGGSSPFGWPWESARLAVGYDVDTGEELFHASVPTSGPSGATALALAGDALFAAGAALAAGGAVDVALARYELPALVSGETSASLRDGGKQHFRLRAGAASALLAYQLFGSLALAQPGVELPGGLFLPLERDAFFALALDGELAAFRGYSGALDAKGRARARLSVPAATDPSLAGTLVHHAAAVFASDGTAELVTNLVELELAP